MTFTTRAEATAIALVVVSLHLAALRVQGVTHEAYQAAAHLWVGGLIAHAKWGKPRFTGLCGWLAGLLTVVETICFAASRLT